MKLTGSPACFDLPAYVEKGIVMFSKRFYYGVVVLTLISLVIIYSTRQYFPTPHTWRASSTTVKSTIDRLESTIEKLTKEVFDLKTNLATVRLEQQSLSRRYLTEKDQIDSTRTKLRDYDQYQHMDNSAYPLDNAELALESNAAGFTPAEKIAALDEQMNQQVNNPEWELSAAEAIKSGFEKAGISGVSLDDSYCRGRMCRFEVTYKDETIVDQILISDMLTQGDKGKVVTTDNYDGTFRTVFYFNSNKLIEE